MKALALVLSLLFSTNVYADIFLFTGMWSGQGNLTINGRSFLAKVELNFEVTEGNVIYEDRYRIDYNGNAMIVKSKVSDITYAKDELFHRNSKVGVLAGNKILTDYTAPNGTRQVLLLEVSNGQMAISKEITQKNGLLILESAVLTRAANGTLTGLPFDQSVVKGGLVISSDPIIEDSKGKSALDSAKALGDPDILKALESKIEAKK